MMVTEIQLYEALTEHLGKEKARTLTEYIESKVEKKFTDEKRAIVSEIEAKISETKADLLKWMIVLFAPFYVGLIAFLVKHFL
jgi:hypothetical protein